jgi:hypothetical protein
MNAPHHRIDSVVGVERCDDDIGDGAVAFRVTRLACKLDPYLPKPRRKGGIQDRFWTYILHIGIAPSVYGLEANATL